MSHKGSFRQWLHLQDEGSMKVVRRCRAAMGPKLFARAIVDFSNRRFQKFPAREKNRTRVFCFRRLCPRVGREWRLSSLESRWLWRTRPTSWLVQVLALYTPLKKAKHALPSFGCLACLAGGVHLTLSDDLVVGSCGIRKKTRSRAGTPDAGALLFKELLLFGWGYRVTPGVSPGRS